MNLVEFANLMGEVLILGLALSEPDPCTGFLPEIVEKLMLAVAIFGVIVQIIVIAYEMGPMILEKVRTAIALAKRAARWVDAKLHGRVQEEDEEDEDDAEEEEDELEAAEAPHKGRGNGKIVVGIDD